MDIPIIIMIIGVLVALTNVIVEVVKKVTWDKLPTNIVALIVSEVLTIAAGVIYFTVSGYLILWYHIFAFVILGFMVSYAAMFGFDKLKEIMNWDKPTTE